MSKSGKVTGYTVTEHLPGALPFKQALWILEHQIGPNVYGLKWHAVVTILEALKHEPNQRHVSGAQR